MTVTDKDLFLAILSMDAYNRGAGNAIDLSFAGSGIGNATLTNDQLPAGSGPVGFSAVAYDDTQWGKVISFRGTDLRAGCAATYRLH